MVMSLKGGYKEIQKCQKSWQRRQKSKMLEFSRQILPQILVLNFRV